MSERSLHVPTAVASAEAVDISDALIDQMIAAGGEALWKAETVNLSLGEAELAAEIAVRAALKVLPPEISKALREDRLPL
jgi:hypothetical protein